MPSIATELVEWASRLPYWEQAALDAIAAGVTFTDAHYDRLLRYLLEDADLEERGERPPLHFAGTAAQTSGSEGPVKLLAISNLQDVNALAPGQVLSFGPGLTAVYGGNGSGKSGYARVLGCAGFTRGDKEVLPDVTRPATDTGVPCAQIQITNGGDRSIDFQVGSACHELSSLYVFDSTSVRKQLTSTNPFSFTPAGLSHLTELAHVADEVQERLQASITERSRPNRFAALFASNTRVAELVRELGANTDVEALRSLSVLTVQDTKRAEELQIEIARLKSEDIPGLISRLQRTIGDLQELIDALDRAGQRLGDTEMARTHDAIASYLKWRAVTESAGVDQFGAVSGSQAGSDPWQDFVAAARALAALEGDAAAPYPQQGQPCLLCRQPLSAAACEHLHHLWAFLDAQAHTRLEECVSGLETLRRRLAGVSLDFFGDQSVSRRHLEEHEAQLSEKVMAFVEAARMRRQSALAMLGARETGPVDPLPDSGASEIQAVIAALDERITALRGRDPADTIRQREGDLRELQHRELLSLHLGDIERFVEDERWVRRASKAKVSTHHVTAKYNELFTHLVTERYLALFEEILAAMGRPVKVHIETRGQKGKTLKRIALRTDPLAPSDRATPERVLSEGEKRAVALADFLTEVATDDTSSGIVLDDPVTSLDFEWKEAVAPRLVAEAEQRQVIVFTHDLHFLYLLTNEASARGVDMATHWIKRGDLDDKPGYVYLNNSPSKEKSYRNASLAREYHRRGKEAPPQEQERILRDGFAALRTTYEAFVVFDLFAEVVRRFEERISIDRLKDVVVDQAIIREVVSKVALLSRHIEGHLHSDVSSPRKPTPQTLLAEIEAFEALKKRHASLRKQSQ